MNVENNATRIRRRLMIRLAKLAMTGQIDGNVDRLPVMMYPRRGGDVRCCVHKDRAVTRYRLMALMGHRVEDETDELTPLSDYARRARERDAAPEGPMLTVIDEACSACVRKNYFVTNACQGCLARPCAVNCPKDAIEFVDGQARINEEKCVNCGLCQKVCPYHAVVYMPVPCEEACPVGAITKDETGKEEIDPEKCIACGKCMTACPFGAVMERSHLLDVIEAIRDGRKVTAMLAPALAGQFPDGMAKLVTAVRELGFNDVVEVAEGAAMTAHHEAGELRERLEQGEPFMATSCCPAWVETVRKHVPELADKISETPSPMHYTAAEVRKRDPEAVTVFVGPCAAKRHEASGDDAVDYVLTTEELGAMLVAAGVEVSECAEADLETIRGEARGFATTGGVTEAVKTAGAEVANLNPVTIDGLDKKTIKQLKAYARGKAPGNFVEVMCCEGGCVGGPCSIEKTAPAARRVKKFAEK